MSGGGRTWLNLLRSRRWQSSSSLLPPPVTRFEAMSENHRGFVFALAGFLGGSAFIYSIISPNKFKISRIKNMMGVETRDPQGLERRKLTSREKRFTKFSSVEYDGQIYMTPQDFLESVIEAEPKPRLKRRNLTAEDLTSLKYNTPGIVSSCDSMFRNLGNKGIISYSEYLFLLTILIKPFSGFKIAFCMLDQDDSGRIDKMEFQVLETIFTAAAKVMCYLLRGIAIQSDYLQERMQEDNDNGLMKHQGVDMDTSILLHLIGQDGAGELEFKQF